MTNSQNPQSPVPGIGPGMYQAQGAYPGPAGHPDQAQGAPAGYGYPPAYPPVGYPWPVQGYPGAYYPNPGPYGYAAPEGAYGQSQSSGSNLLGFANERFFKGLLVGAAAAYLLTNESVQRTAIRAVVKAWSLVQGGVEELKERFHDAEAEVRAEEGGQ